MKSILWSAAVLLIAAVVCFGYGLWTDCAVEEVMGQIRQCEAALEAENLPEAQRTLAYAEESWSRREKIFAAAVSHHHMTEIRRSFVRMDSLLCEKDLDSGECELRQLCLMLEEFRKQEQVSLKNLF